jgi:hypothetical protein
VQASLEQRQRFQQLFFPEGLAFDGNGFGWNRRNRTGLQRLAADRTSPLLWASGFDTARRAVLKTSPGRALSEEPNSGPESKPDGRTIRLRHE